MTEPKRSSNAGSPSRKGRKLLLSLGALLALFVAVEIGGRLLPIRALSRDELDPLSRELGKALIEPHPYLAYANKPNYRHEPTPEEPYQRSHNSLGFRGPETIWEKPAGTYRIVCLGGSSTYGFGPTSDAANWPMRLEQHLREANPAKKIEVINGGCQGYSTFECAINLAIRMVDFAPDLVIVYEAINDMRCALYPNAQHDNTHWRAVWPRENASSVERLLEHSYAYLIWRRYATDWWEERKNLGSYVIVDFGKWAPDDFAQPAPGDLGFRNYQRNLVDIVQVARGHGAEVLLVTQACRDSDFDRFGSKDLQRDGMRRMREILFAVAKERGVPICDAAPVLEAEAARQIAATGDESIFTDQSKYAEVHLGDAGCDLLAQTIAKTVLAERLLEK